LGEFVGELRQFVALSP